jgi:hypothetical protein
MKKLFENWKRYVNEGEDPMSTVHRSTEWSSGGHQPDEVGADEDIPKDEEDNLQWDNVEMPSDIRRKARAFWEHLNDLLKQWRPTEGESIQYKKDLHALMNDFLTGPDERTPRPPEEPSSPEEEEYTMLPRPEEDPMGRGAQTSKLRKQSMGKKASGHFGSHGGFLGSDSTGPWE